MGDDTDAAARAAATKLGHRPSASEMAQPGAERATMWASIRDTLAGEIASGKYPTGSRLPAEQALASRFAVNRHTVRRALADLSASGLIHVRRGAGATVTADRMDYPVGRRTRFSENVTAAGRRPGHRMLRLETLPADAEEAAALEVEPGEAILVTEGVALADELPVAWSRHLFPAVRLPGFAEAMASNPGITAALRSAGIARYSRRTTRIGAALPSTEIARHLAIAATEPILETHAVDVDDDGRPVNIGHTCFAAGRVTLVVGEDGVRCSTERLLDALTDSAMASALPDEVSE